MDPWLKSQFTRPAQAVALEEALQAPQDTGAIETLQLQIRRALEQEDFRREFLELLPKEVHPPGITQTATTTGNDTITIQNAGSGIISVSK